MKKEFLVGLVLVLAMGIALSGCTRAYISEKERVDQSLEGNRGALLGAPPAVSERKSTREVIEVDVEIPLWREVIAGFKKGAARKRSGGDTVSGNKGFITGGGIEAPTAVPEREAGPSFMERLKEKVTAPLKGKEKQAAVQPKAAEGGYMLYKVQKNDTLGKIAARDDVYGNESKWKLIYDANKDTLKSPNKIYPGQLLRIPKLSAGAAEEAEEVK